jgi:hypothetical protein
VFMAFNQKLFTTEGTQGAEECLEAMEERVSLAMNEALLKEFTMEDVCGSFSDASAKITGSRWFLGVFLSTLVGHCSNEGW